MNKTTAKETIGAPALSNKPLHVTRHRLRNTSLALVRSCAGRLNGIRRGTLPINGAQSR
ncbi:hypothetical protein M0D44_13205 [Xanthomonas prunicola]|uniref:hypothetical protein n=1 Tax=Xanthomonas prunicola TaxID=2053930 RepID=UPI0021B35386|nr:hypothetical protein [Xanthomonas prunicola]UXA47327.1 hypothetical protein M0D44_13205 [Xanthomonas prunicola]UXA61745.1 hypothetical protein M0D48_01535 [Xanthomonas prunicola]